MEITKILYLKPESLEPWYIIKCFEYLVYDFHTTQSGSKQTTL